MVNDPFRIIRELLTHFTGGVMQQLRAAHQRIGELEAALLAIQETLDEVLQDDETESDPDE